MSSIAQVLNQAFIDCLDTDMAKAQALVLTYVMDRVGNLPSHPEVACKFYRDGNLVTLVVKMVIDGRSVGGKGEWTMMELLTIDRPVTQLFDEVIKSVFEAPSEGAPVS